MRNAGLKIFANVRAAKRWVVLPVVLLAGGVLCKANAQTTVKAYRYEVSLDTGDYGYSGEIAPGVSPKGTYYKVERDAKGRMVRETKMRNGKEQTLMTFHYTGSSRYWDSTEEFRDGEKTQISLYQRDPQGRITHEDDETADGKLTQYWTTILSPHRMDASAYDPNHIRTSHFVADFSVGGVQVHKITYLSQTSAASYSENDYDENTGEIVASRQFDDGKLQNTRKYSYDGNGDKTRMDAYDPNGKWFAADEYTEGLWVRRLYKLPNGTTATLKYSYDAKQWLQETDIKVNDQPLCKLTYDRESDGTVKRTLAIGADGTLWAEYPPPQVRDIGQDGQPAGRTDGVIHKTGSWW
jgi:hypothetical protein